MRTVVAALLVVGHLLGLASGTRLAEEHPATGPASVAAPLDPNRPRQTKRGRWVKLPSMLPLMAGASDLLAGASLFGFGGGRGLWRPLWKPKARARALSLGADVSRHQAFASARRRLAPALMEDAQHRSATSLPQDGPWHGGARRGRALSIALALRGGSERSEESAEHAPSEHSSQNFGGHPAAEEQRLEVHKAMLESQALLLKGAWKATVRYHQVLRVEFVFLDGLMYAEIAYRDPPGSEFELVSLSPMVVPGRFQGFGGGTGILFYHFSIVGDDLRIDIRYPSSYLDGRDQMTMLGYPVARRGAATSPSPAPVNPMQERLVRSMERLREKSEELPPYHEIVSHLKTITALLQKPGRWIGRAPLSGTLLMYDISLTFIPREHSFNLTLTFQHKNTTVMDTVEILPWNTGDFATTFGRSPGYALTAADDGLWVEITYFKEDFLRKVNTRLDFEFVVEEWDVSALYGRRREETGMEGN